MKVRAFAPAKINLTLDIVGRREDGYHLLESVMQTVDLCDTVTVAYADDGEIYLSCDGGIPCDTTNTAYRAAALFREKTKTTDGFIITVEKRIPSQAGLAGGSSDAAAVLVALNVLTKANLSSDALCEIGASIGADVPFCIRGGTVLCTDIGTELTPLSAIPPCTVVIAKPQDGVSTPEAYRLLDTADRLEHPDTDGMCRAIARGDLIGLSETVGNSFERPLNLPHTARIRRQMEEYGAIASALSGSGSAVFGLFDDDAAANRATAALLPDYPQTFLCRPCDGIRYEILE